MRITVAQAAELLNVSPQFVRIGLQRGQLPIGSAVKMSSKWTYHISAHLLEQYMGKKAAHAVEAHERQGEIATKGIISDGKPKINEET